MPAPGVWKYRPSRLLLTIRRGLLLSIAVSAVLVAQAQRTTAREQQAQAVAARQQACWAAVTATATIGSTFTSVAEMQAQRCAKAVSP